MTHADRSGPPSALAASHIDGQKVVLRELRESDEPTSDLSTTIATTVL